MEKKVVVNNDCIDDIDYINTAVDSYLTKDELIKIIETSDFYAIKYMDLQTITSFVALKNSDGRTIVNTRGYDIKID